MNESNRINRRARPRSYDLRRKVLLKNFLHEQMTYIPPLRERSETSANSSFVDSQPSTSTDLNEVITDLNDENNSPSLVAASEPESMHIPGPESLHVPEPESMQIPLVLENLVVPSTSKLDNFETLVNFNDDVVDRSLQESTAEKPRRSKFSRFSSLMRLRRSSKKKRSKGSISKAKHVLKNIKNPMKSKFLSSSMDKIFSPQTSVPSTSKQSESQGSSQFSQSVFSIFKPGKKDKKPEKVINNANLLIKNANSASCSTSNQAVQTDLSFSLSGMNSIEKSNKLLREENKLLSQSLSLLLSESSNNISHQNSEKTTTILSHNHDVGSDVLDLPFLHDKRRSNRHNSSSSKEISRNCRLQRSHSVQDHPERRSVASTCHRTRSMNSHNCVHANTVIMPPLFAKGSSSSAVSRVYEQHRSYQTRTNDQRPLSVSRTSRTLRRRSSMPQQKRSENVRHLPSRRASSVQDYSRRNNSVPFQDLPIQAFY